MFPSGKTYATCHLQPQWSLSRRPASRSEQSASHPWQPQPHPAEPPLRNLRRSLSSFLTTTTKTIIRIAATATHCMMSLKSICIQFYSEKQRWQPAIQPSIILIGRSIFKTDNREPMFHQVVLKFFFTSVLILAGVKSEG